MVQQNLAYMSDSPQMYCTTDLGKVTMYMHKHPVAAHTSLLTHQSRLAQHHKAMLQQCKPGSVMLLLIQPHLAWSYGQANRKFGAALQGQFAPAYLRVDPASLPTTLRGHRLPVQHKADGVSACPTGPEQCMAASKPTSEKPFSSKNRPTQSGCLKGRGEGGRGQLS